METINKELQEIEVLRNIKTNVQKEIDRLQIILGNLQAQEHSSQIKDEGETKLKEIETLNKFASDERRIELKRIEAEGRIDSAEKMQRDLDNRVIEVEKRELKTMELEVKISEMNQQRANFEIYKVGIEDQLAEAKVTIAEANALEEKLKIANDMLLGREKKVKEEEKYWNDCIGLLEEERKKFQIEKENFLGLKQNKEAANV